MRDERWEKEKEKERDGRERERERGTHLFIWPLSLFLLLIETFLSADNTVISLFMLLPAIH